VLQYEHPRTVDIVEHLVSIATSIRVAIILNNLLVFGAWAWRLALSSISEVGEGG